MRSSHQRNQKRFVEQDTTSYNPDTSWLKRELNQMKSKPFKTRSCYFEKMNTVVSKPKLDM